jgi:hypothetical protein
MTSASIGVGTTGAALVDGAGDDSDDGDGVGVEDEQAPTKSALAKIATRPRTLGGTRRS